MSENPTSGHDPALPETHVSLLDFPPEVREILGRLDASAIKSLAVQARSAICHIDEKTLPTDLREEAKGAQEALRRTPAYSIDDGLADVRDTLTVAVALLTNVDELDIYECRALGNLLHRAETFAAQEAKNVTEVQRRLYVALEGYVHGR